MPPPFFKRVAASAGLSVLFLIVYGGTNWFTSQRADVSTLFFEWERLIPFVPLMIVPYMSIDLFFLGAPFLCRTNGELRTFCLRVAAAIIVAGLCFLLFPLRFAFDRPLPDGWLGVVYDWFRSMDQPFNMLPSLHITFRTLLAETYTRHTRGALRMWCHVWFSLIGASTVLTYQHHVMDIVGGFVLAGYCFYVFPESRARLPVIPNRRIGAYYLAAAILVLLTAILLRPWGILLLWPAIAFAIVASAYFGVGPGIFRKHDGRLPLGTRWALGPSLFLQWLSLRYYRRRCELWNQVTPHVWIGGVPNRTEAENAIAAGATAVLDLTAEFTAPEPFRALCYRNLPILDLTAPSPEQLLECAAFIEEQSRKGIVYVHCKIGYSRSAAAVAAYLLQSGHANSVGSALDTLQRARPSIIVRPEARKSLEEVSRLIAARG